MLLGCEVGLLFDAFLIYKCSFIRAIIDTFELRAWVTFARHFFIYNFSFKRVIIDTFELRGWMLWTQLGSYNASSCFYFFRNFLSAYGVFVVGLCYL